MKQMFIVMARNFDYNDEYFFATEGGEAVIIYDDLAKAQTASDTRNTSEILEMERVTLSEHLGGYDLDCDVIDEITALTGNARLEALRAAHIDLELYYVAPVEVG